MEDTDLGVSAIRSSCCSRPSRRESVPNMDLETCLSFLWMIQTLMAPAAASVPKKIRRKIHALSIAFLPQP